MIKRYSNKQSVSFQLEVWEQPWWRYAVAAGYHWYDMRVYKLPGFKVLERFLHQRAKVSWHMPLSIRQDVRCHDLTHRKRVVLATLPVDTDSDIVKKAWPEG